MARRGDEETRLNHFADLDWTTACQFAPCGNSDLDARALLAAASLNAAWQEPPSACRPKAGDGAPGRPAIDNALGVAYRARKTS